MNPQIIMSNARDYILKGIYYIILLKSNSRKCVLNFFSSYLGRNSQSGEEVMAQTAFAVRWLHTVCTCQNRIQCTSNVYSLCQ